MLRMIFAIFLLSLMPAAVPVWGAEVLVADRYIETPQLRRFARSFRSPDVLGICTDTLAPQTARVKITGCELETCAENGCAPRQCQSPKNAWREIAIHSDCKASAFLVEVGGLKSGPILAAGADSDRNKTVGHIEGYRFRVSGRDYHVRVAMMQAGTAQPRARLEILQDGKPYSILLEQDAHDLSCSVHWMGDLNRDGVPDIVYSCFRNIYERFSGLFLSRQGTTGRYELIRQREVGGNI